MCILKGIKLAMFKSIPIYLGIAVIFSAPAQLQAAQSQESGQSLSEQPLSDRVEDLKAEVLKLNRDLFILEEDLLYPASTAVTLYVSMDKGEYFQPDSVEVTIDGKRVTSHLYTEREVSALQRGGIQKVHQGNVKAGQHAVVATFVGQGPENREYRRAVRHEFSHSGDGVNLELKISDDHTKQQPDFSVKQWQE